MIELTPIKMRPCYKEYLWGGTRLKPDFGKSDAPDVTAESWELAAHPDGVSTGADGAFAGKTLFDLAALDRDAFWGKACRSDTFPLLVKLIDAEKDLSIQVHPSDATALAERGEQGKAEMWYIVDAKPNAAIYYGFSQKVSKGEFIRRAQDGTICEVLNRVPVSAGDMFFILPGTIHAIGAGIVIAEIQQNSNTTFRVYDYLRRGADGKLRPLHLERAVDVLDFTPVIPSECRANNSLYLPEYTFSEMFSCRYFQSYCIDVRVAVTLRCDGESFHHLLCVDGAGTIAHQGKEYPFTKGESYFLPARTGEYTVSGKCRVLLSKV